MTMVDDVIRRGGDREPGRWTGWLAALAVLIVLAVAIVGHLPRGSAAPQHHPAAAATAGPVQLAGLGAGAAGQLNKAYLITASPLPRADRIRLLVTGAYSAWLWSAMGHAKPVGGLQGVRSGQLYIRFVRVGGGSVFQLTRR
jgi:hypothetical protein